MKSLRFAAGLFCLLVASELRAQGPLYLPSSPVPTYAQSPVSVAPATNSSGYYFAPSSPNSTTRIGSASSAPTLIVSSSPTSSGGRVTTTYAPSSNSALPSSSTTVYYAPTSNNTASTVGSIDTRSNVSSFKSIYPVTTASYSAPSNSTPSYSTSSYAVQSNAAPASSSVYTPASTSQVWSNSSYSPSISPPTQVASNEVRYAVPADYAPTLTFPSTTTYPTSGVQYYPGNSLPNTVYRQTRSGSSCQPSYGVNSPASLPPSLGYGVPANNSPYKALLPLQKMPNNTYVGQGLIGQPKAFVEGQPVRNFFRYILP